MNNKALTVVQALHDFGVDCRLELYADDSGWLVITDEFKPQLTIGFECGRAFEVTGIETEEADAKQS